VFSPDGELLASASNDWTVRLWTPGPVALQCTLEGHSSSVTAVVFSPDGELLASASLRPDSPALGRQDRRPLPAHRSRATPAWSGQWRSRQTGSFFASASNDWTVRLWDARTGALQRTLEGHSSWVRAVAFSTRRGASRLSLLRRRTVRLWDARPAPSSARSRATPDGSRQWRFSPDGELPRLSLLRTGQSGSGMPGPAPSQCTLEATPAWSQQ